MEKRKIAIIVLVVVFFLFSTTANGLTAFQVGGKAAILIDAETGQVLYQKNIHQRRPPASTTKIMTGILAIEEGDLASEVTVSQRAAAEGGSSIYLTSEESLPLKEMIYGLLVKSGNDAAVAIAEHIGGSVNNFAQLMNQKAREVGARHTTFQNPNGLPENGHLTTAYDLAQITRYALQNDFFSQVVGTPKKRISWPQHKWDRILENTNRLLTRFEIVDGVKTGYTDAAGKCLVASATKQGQQLISVVLNSSSIWQDSINLLNYGFDNYRRSTIINKGKTVKQVEIAGEQVNLQAAKDFSLVLPKQESTDIKKVIETRAKIDLPVEKGEKVGTIAICDSKNQLLGRVELLADRRVAAPPLKSFFKQLTSRIQTCF